MEEAGGFGKFQFLALLIGVMINNQGDFIVMSQGYFTMFPKYTCHMLENGEDEPISKNSNNYFT